MDKCCAKLKSNGKKCENKANTVRNGFNLCGVHSKINFIEVLDNNNYVALNGPNVQRSQRPSSINAEFLRQGFERVEQYRREHEASVERTEYVNNRLAFIETDVNNSFDFSRRVHATMSNVKKETAVVSGMCSICQDVIYVGENITILIKCNHNYHKECLDPWICKNNSCPDCRAMI